MNKSMLIGIAAGIAIAAAGAVVAGYALHDDDATGITGVDTSTPAAAASSAEPSAPEPSAATQTAAAAPQEECWDETVTHPVEPKDDKRIAGTAIGAVVGGIVGHQFGGGTGKTVATAAGAAGGAYAGRKAQEKYQDGKTYTTTERKCKPVQ